MSKKNDCWGIEVGANAIKAMRLQRVGGEVNVVEYEVMPFKRILTTPDLNVDEHIRVALDQLVNTHDLSKSTVMVSIPGHMAFARFAKLPPVEPKKIPDIVEFEAAQQVPFPIEQVEWDYHIFSRPDSPDVEVGIFAITREKVRDFLEDYRQAGVLVDGVTLSPLAVYNAVAYDLNLTNKSRGTVMVDIGTTSTDVIIYHEGNLWLRTLPTGGNKFTEALVQSFKLSFSKAEKLKREASTSKYARQIFTALRPVFADLVQEVQRSLGYYQSLNREVQLEKLIGFGSTFRLPGMQKYFKQQIHLDVGRPVGFERISVEDKRAADFAKHTVNMATAYGLALQGLGLGRIDANVLPSQQLRQKLWRSKRSLFAVSAAMVALPALLLWANIITTNARYGHAVKETDSKVNGVIAQANKYKKEWGKIESSDDPKPLIQGLERVLNYREVWPKILQDINDAAAATAPQQSTVTSDYDAIAEIDRKVRRRIYIERVEAHYRYQLRDGQQGKSQYGLVTSKKSKDFTKLFAEYLIGLEITAIGTTPFADSATFIDSTFIKWLRENSDRPDRPYRIVVSDQPFTVRPVGSGQSGQAEDSRAGVLAKTPGGRSGRRRQTRRNNWETSNPEMPGEGGQSGQRFNGAGEEVKVDLSSLLPHRPLADESRLSDWEFRISWFVELVEPQDALDSETGHRIKKQKDSTQNDGQLSKPQFRQRETR